MFIVNNLIMPVKLIGREPISKILCVFDIFGNTLNLVFSDINSLSEMIETFQTKPPMSVDIRMCHPSNNSASVYFREFNGTVIDYMDGEIIHFEITDTKKIDISIELDEL